MPTALELIHTVAERIGRYDRRTTTSTGTTSTLVCSRYANTNLVASVFADHAVLIESGLCAGEMGRVAKQGLATTSGTLTTATTFTAAIASGVSFSLYSRDRLPPYRDADRPGLLEIANQAAMAVGFEDTISIAGVTDAEHYSMDLTTYPWITDDTRIIEIQEPVTAADDIPRVLPRTRWTWVSDGETRRLRFYGAPFRTGETFTVKVSRPGNSRLIKNAQARATLSTTTVGSVTPTFGGYYSAVPTVSFSGGGGTGAAATAVLTNGVITSFTVTNAGSAYTSVPLVTITRNAADSGWADQSSQTAGLETLTDELIPDVRLMRPTMLALAFQELAENGAPGATEAEWMAKAAFWRSEAASFRTNRQPRDANDGVIDLRSTAVSGRRSRTFWDRV